MFKMAKKLDFICRDLNKFTHSRRRIETVVSQPGALWHGWNGVCTREDSES